MAKYVIEIPDDNVLGNELCVRLSVNEIVRFHATGIKLTPYTEPDEQSVKNNSIHLCLSCQNIYPECHAEVKDVLFGDGKGNDNICCCNAYRPIISDEQEIKDKAYEEAWEFAKKFTHESLGGLTTHERMEIWGMASCDKIINDFTYSEAKARYDVWKKKKEEIRVGDEIRHNPSGEIAIAIRVLPTCVYGIVTSKDEMELAQWNIYNLTKTGRSFPEVAELLEKMKEEP